MLWRDPPKCGSRLTLQPPFSFPHRLSRTFTSLPKDEQVLSSIQYTLWLFNIAMENGPFIDGLPIKNGDFQWQTVSHNQRVIYKVTLSRHFFLSNTFHWVAIGGRDQSPNRRQRRLKRIWHWRSLAENWKGTWDGHWDADLGPRTWQFSEFKDWTWLKPQRSWFVLPKIWQTYFVLIQTKVAPKMWCQWQAIWENQPPLVSLFELHAKAKWPSALGLARK